MKKYKTVIIDIANFNKKINDDFNFCINLINLHRLLDSNLIHKEARAFILSSQADSENCIKVLSALGFCHNLNSFELPEVIYKNPCGLTGARLFIKKNLICASKVNESNRYNEFRNNLSFNCNDEYSEEKLYKRIGIAFDGPFIHTLESLLEITDWYCIDKLLSPNSIY